MKRSEFKGISKRGRQLLSRGEDRHVDYKKSVKGLHAEDLVAFANSNDGGSILIGVEETKDANGQQRGVPVGCNIGDEAKLQIMGKALSCSPPVQIELFVENVASKPFYRIEIPSGSNSPHSTNSGTYKIREDGRNKPIHPEELLAMFLEKEGEEFRARFSQATGELESRMANTLNTVENLEGVVSNKIEEIAGSMGLAEYEASSARSTIEDVESYTHSIHQRTQKLERRIRALLQHLEAADPVKEDAKNEVLEHLIEQLKNDEKLLAAVEAGQTLSVTLKGDAAEEIGETELNQLVVEAVLALKGRDEEA